MTAEKSNTQKYAENAEVIGETAKNTVVLKGIKEPVDVYKCRVGHIGTILRFISGFFNQAKIKDFDEKEIQKAFENLVSTPYGVLNIISGSVDEALSVVEALCSLNRNQLNELEIDDGIILFKKIYEVNRDFFLQNVLPMISQLAEKEENKN